MIIYNWFAKSKKDRLNLSKTYKECHLSSTNYIKRKSKFKSDAEDIFHEAIIIYYDKLIDGSYKKNKPPCAYIFGIIKNLLKVWARKSLKTPITIDDSISESQDPNIEEFLRREQLVKEVEILLNEIKNKNQRRTLYLKFILGYSYEEICKEVGCDIQVARNRISLGTKSLRALIKTKPGLKEALKELLKDE